VRSAKCGVRSSASGGITGAGSTTLGVVDLVTGYGKKQVVNGVTLEVGKGEKLWR
jgi:hypothetical protein